MNWSPLTINLGLLGAMTRDEEEFVTELRNVPEGWLGLAGLAVVVALGWAVVWMYRHEGRRGASRRVRTIMAGLRVAVLLLLVAVLLEPVRVRLLRRWVDSYTIVLVDDSSSMDLADRYADPDLAQRVQRVMGTETTGAIPRREIARRLLTDHDRRFLAKLAERNRVKLYTFSDAPELLGTIKANREAPANPRGGGEPGGGNEIAAMDDVPIRLQATGSATNLERAVRRSIDSVGSAPIAAVVVLSDGGFNQGAAAEDVAKLARQRRLAVHVLGIGDPAPPKNVRLTDVVAPVNVFLKDPFAITARLTAQGLSGQSIQVQLRQRDATSDGAGQLVDSKNIAVASDGTMDPVVFQRRPERTGRFAYTVSVPVLEGESVTDDNSKPVTVNVIESKTKALIVAGAPSWDYRYLSRLLERDETFDVSCWLQSADLSAVRDGNTVIDHLPRLPEELFEYDVVVLLDPDKSAFDDPWCRLIDTWVTEHGGGLLYAAARAYSPGFLRDDRLTLLSDLLPVTLDPDADLLLNRIGHYQFKGWPVQMPESSLGHPVLRLADDPGSNKLLWAESNEVYWHYPVLREKPAATVLMRHGDPRMRNSHGSHVLAALQFVGSGRTGFLAFDGTWRWRKYGEERFDRFWVQWLRYLAEGKLLGGARRAMLVTDSDQFALGESVDVSARLLDARYDPLIRDQVAATVLFETRKAELILRSRPNQPGWVEGQFVPDRTGSYRISLSMADPDGGKELTATKEIFVTRPNIEILNPQTNRANLTALAEQSFGGSYFEVDEAEQLSDAVADLHEEIIIRSRPKTLWDNAWALTALLGLLIVEWGLRKWFRLL